MQPNNSRMDETGRIKAIVRQSWGSLSLDALIARSNDGRSPYFAVLTDPILSPPYNIICAELLHRLIPGCETGNMTCELTYMGEARFCVTVFREHASWLIDNMVHRVKRREHALLMYRAISIGGLRMGMESRDGILQLDDVPMNSSMERLLRNLE